MNIIWSEKIKLIQILLGLKNHPNTNIKKIHPNTNTNIWLKKSPEYEYEYYSVWKNHPNTNTNIIRFENIDRIRIRIFWYSNIIRIIFEYRIIRSPLHYLLRLLLLLMLMMRIVLATVCCRFGSWGLVIKLSFCSDFEHFGQDFEVEVQARFWSWSLVGILLLMFGSGYKVESWSIFWS